MIEGAPLNEFTRDEWWDVCRLARPDLDRETFERMWDEFIAWKRKRGLQ